MKKLLLIISATMIVGTAFPQSDTAKTEFERFMNRKGVALVKEVFDINFFQCLIGSLYFEYTIFTDLNTNEKIGGVIVKSTKSNGSTTKSSEAFLDYSDILILEDWIRWFKDNYASTSPENFTEVMFTTNGDCKFKFYYNPKISNKWMMCVSTDRVWDSDFSYFLKKETLDNILFAFDKAKGIIHEKTGK